MLIEPEGRNATAAVGLGIARCLAADENEVLGIFPADHHIADEAYFIKCLQKAQMAAEVGYLETIGIRPSRPETGYGYLERSRNEFGTIPKIKPTIVPAGLPTE